MTPAPEIPNLKMNGTAMEILKEVCARTLQDFAIITYSEANETNLMNTVDQVIVWQQ